MTCWDSVKLFHVSLHPWAHNSAKARMGYVKSSSFKILDVPYISTSPLYHWHNNNDLFLPTKYIHEINLELDVMIWLSFDPKCILELLLFPVVSYFTSDTRNRPVMIHSHTFSLSIHLWRWHWLCNGHHGEKLTVKVNHEADLIYDSSQWKYIYKHMCTYIFHHVQHMTHRAIDISSKP